MVSFSCEQCNDTVKKPKLDQHAGRCRGAYFTCIDCNTTFEGTSYRAHTSCVSEEQRYHKSIYKAPKGKGKKAQQDQNGAPAPASAAAPEPAPAPAPASAPAALVEVKQAEAQPKEVEQKKRAREDDAAAAPSTAAAAVADAPAAAASAVDGGVGEPAQKKKKKSKKAKGEAAAGEASGAAAEEAGSTAAAPSVKTFLSETVTPLLAGDNVSLADVREKVVEQAKAKGFKVDEVEKALWAGLKVGGKKQKVRADFA
ncbi:hypothetical protein JCM8208_003641 [Rhodotorula glutinis]